MIVGVAYRDNLPRAMFQLKSLRSWFFIVLALSGLYLLYFHSLGSRELWSSHEARAAQDAQTILETGDWRLPHLFDGRPELQKPPLYYWLTALIGWFEGHIDELSVRLPATLSALLTGLALFIFLQQRANSRAGLFAAIVLLTMIHFTWMGRVGRVDMPLTCAITWSIVSFLLGNGTREGVSRFRRFSWYFLGYLSLTAGLMLKGPIAVVLVGTVLLLTTLTSNRFIVVEKSRVNIRSLLVSLTWGLPLVALLILPWCWWVNEATQGRFVSEFLIKHNFHRGFGGDEQLDAHIHSWWFYLERIWLDWAPWSLVLPFSLWWLWKNRQSEPEACYGFLWTSSVLALLSVLQYKRADYLLPAYPGGALFIGITLERWLSLCSLKTRQFAVKIGVGLLACLALGWLGYVEWILPKIEPLRALAPFAKTVRTYYPNPCQVILFRVDSHHLNWQLGRTTERIWEWENLSWWALRPTPIYVIMPQRYADECAEQLQAGHLTPLATTSDGLAVRHELPLVLLVNDPGWAQASLVRDRLNGNH
jgi:4-amino-4-deoxy-L-arabinose transferase-like glycosyltransferase